MNSFKYLIKHCTLPVGTLLVDKSPPTNHSAVLGTTHTDLLNLVFDCRKEGRLTLNELKLAYCFVIKTYFQRGYGSVSVYLDYSMELGIEEDAEHQTPTHIPTTRRVISAATEDDPIPVEEWRLILTDRSTLGTVLFYIATSNEILSTTSGDKEMWFYLGDTFALSVSKGVTRNTQTENVSPYISRNEVLARSYISTTIPGCPADVFPSKDMDVFLGMAIADRYDLLNIRTSMVLDGLRINLSFFGEACRAWLARPPFEKLTLKQASLYIIIVSLTAEEALGRGIISKEEVGKLWISAASLIGGSDSNAGPSNLKATVVLCGPWYFVEVADAKKNLPKVHLSMDFLPFLFHNLLGKKAENEQFNNKLNGFHDKISSSMNEIMDYVLS